MTIQILIFLLIISLISRAVFQLLGDQVKEDAVDGMAQSTGNKEVQADVMQVRITSAGKLAVLADGIGKENTGKVCASLAVKELIEAFSFYKALHNPEYFFQRTLYRIHKEIQRLLEEGQGGASVAAVFLGGGRLHYALAGQIQLALFRKGELIPLSEGQTIGVLAQQAYKNGKISRQKTLQALKAKDIWNYVGKDGFHQMEICEIPIELKKGDLVVMMTKGIFEEVSYACLERILINPSLTAQEKAEKAIRLVERSGREDKENGSILVLLTDGAMSG